MEIIAFNRKSGPAFRAPDEGVLGIDPGTARGENSPDGDYDNQSCRSSQVETPLQKKPEVNVQVKVKGKTTPLMDPY
jgi:hypothetical protein